MKEGSWQTPESLCISEFLQVLSSLHSANTECSPWTRVFRAGDTGGGREREEDSQAAVGIKHCEYTREAVTVNCYKGGAVDHDDGVRVGCEQTQETKLVLR